MDANYPTIVPVVVTPTRVTLAISPADFDQTDLALIEIATRYAGPGQVLVALHMPEDAGTIDLQVRPA